MNNTVLKSMDGNQAPSFPQVNKFEQFSGYGGHGQNVRFSDQYQQGYNQNSQSQKVVYQGEFSQQNMTPLRISPYEQSVCTKWAETVTLNRYETVFTDHSDAILCVYFIGDKYVATGSKDKTINVFTVEGKKTATLRGH